MVQQIRKIITAICVAVVAAIAICDRQPEPKPPENVPMIVYARPYDGSAARDFNESLDVVGNYVKRSGDIMWGSLYFGKNTNAFVYQGNGTDTGVMGAAGGFYKAPYPFGGSIQGMSFTSLDTSLYTNGSAFLRLIASGGLFSIQTAGPIEKTGTSAANIAASTPTAGFGAINYDNTNFCFRVYQNGAWQPGCIAITASGSAPVITSNAENPLMFNPDGGDSTTGPCDGISPCFTDERHVTAFNSVTTVAAAKDLISLRISPRSRIEELHTVIHVAGVGVGNAVVSLRGSISGTFCSGNVACAAGATSVTSITCADNIDSETVTVVWDPTGCTTSAVVGIAYNWHVRNP